MVTEFETLKDVEKIIEHIKNMELEDALVVAEQLQVRTKKMCDEFDKWADEESAKQIELDFKDPKKMVTDCV